MNTDTDRIEALEALVNRVTYEQEKVSSELYICGRWKDHKSFMLCLRNEFIGNNEKVLFANSLRQIADKLIEYNQGKI